MKLPLSLMGRRDLPNAPVLLTLSLALATQSPAAERWWSGTTGNFSDSTWVSSTNTAGSIPGSSDAAIVGNGGTVTINSNLTVNELITGRFTGTPPQTGTGTVNITGGIVNVNLWLTAGRNNNPGSNTGEIGTINISGGTVNKSGAAGQTAVGRQSGSVGVLNISGTAIYNSTAGDTVIGGGSGSTFAGTGTFTLSDTADFNQSAGVFHVARGQGSNGTLNIQGGSIDFSSAGEFHVGASATAGGNGGTGAASQSAGVVNITNAASRFAVGSGVNATGNYTISGGQLNVGSVFVLGRDSGAGTMTMTNGQVTKTGSTNVVLGAFGAGASGTLIQSGGTFDIQAGKLVIAEQDTTGTVTLSGNAQLNAPVVSMSERSNAGTSFLNLNGGTLSTGEINGDHDAATYAAKGTSTVNFNGGLLRATGNNSTFIANINNANIGNGGMRVDTGSFTVATSQNFTGTGSGGMVKTGSGSLTLNGGSTHVGATLVSAGSLFVNGALSATSSTTVESGALLGGSGSLANATTVQGNGTISPGDSSTATLSLGSLAIENSGVYLAGITGNMQSDKLNVAGSFNFDGILRVVLGSYVPVAGDSFDLADFSGTITGNWSLDTSLSSLSPGLTWDTSNFASQGIVQIIPEPSASLLGLAGAVVLLRRRRR